jgi:hypothetical protein
MKAIIKAMSDNDLKIAFEEYKELKLTGFLTSDSIMKTTLKRCRAVVNNVDLSITFIGDLIMYEMAYRYYVTLT